MTSVQTMHTETLRTSHRSPLRVSTALLITSLFVLIAGGCGPRLKQPTTLQSPYDADELWAVAPFANESGVSVVDRDRVADMFALETEQIAGVSAIPVNRVLQAMRDLGIESIESELDAAVLMDVLNADALLVGTVTSWDPYRPPTLGLAVELYRREHDTRQRVDPVELTRAPAGDPSLGELAGGPVAQAADVFDAKNHRTLARLEHYADARTHPDSAYGRDIYLVRMDLYTQFASYWLLRDLLARERIRVTPVAAAEDRTQPR